MSDQDNSAPPGLTSEERFLWLKTQLQNGNLSQLPLKDPADPTSKLRSRLYRYAIWLLGRSELSRADLQSKIEGFVARKQEAKVKSFDLPVSELNQIVLSVLDQLSEQNYQSDTRASKTLVRSQVFKGRGKRRIQQELKQKKLDPSAVAEQLDEVNWIINAAELRLKKFGLPLPTEPKEKARQTRFLAYRGFDFDVIRKVLERDIDELREWYGDA